MAQATDEFQGIELDEYTPETSEGKYDRHVRATLAGDERLSSTDPDAYASGKRTRVKIVVPTGEPKTTESGETYYPAVSAERRAFQQSARLRDRTARVVDERNQGDGNTLLAFILIPKQSRARLTDDERAARAANGESPQEVDEDEDE